MVQSLERAETPAYDGLFRRIQQQVNEKIRIPVEIAVRGDRTYRFGKASRRQSPGQRPGGLSALGRSMN